MSSIAVGSGKATPGPDIRPPGMAEYLRLLELWDEAKRHEQAVAFGGDADAIAAARWAVTEAMGDIIRHKENEACYLAMRLRWLCEIFPGAVGPISDLCEGQREYAGRLDNLEAALTAGVPS